MRHAIVDADVERAFADGEILRTHVLRPTWHFVAAEDLGWMLELTAPRIQVSMRTYARNVGLDARQLSRGLAIIERQLAGGRHQTRRELAAHLSRAGLPMTPMHMAFVAMNAELERIICSGPRRGKEFTYALVSERVKSSTLLSADEGLGVLATRFFASHGPATLKDFVWWSGLRSVDARRGLDIASLRSVEHEGLTYWHDGRRTPAARTTGVHLLPIYDEYTVAYRDRVAVPHGPGRIRTGAQVVGFRHALVIDGQIAGTWTIETGRSGTSVRVTPLRRLTRAERDRIDAVVGRYARFIGAQVRPEVLAAGDPV